MKKLMIAAAAAAMVGGAFAETYVYDFTATLKTTVGKAATEKTTYTVNCGVDSDGVYWWDTANDGAEGLDGEEFKNAAEAKKYVKGLTNDEKQEFAEQKLGFDGEDTNFYIQEEYKGRKQWCYTFKYTVTSRECYRVAGSRKITDKINIKTCCNDFGDGDWEFDSDDTRLWTELFYRFGGQTEAKATKVELVAGWERPDDGYAPAAYLGAAQFFYIAGQGTWGTVKKDYDPAVKTASGSIVGILPNPTCKDCCNYGVEALAFDCEGYKFAVDQTLESDEFLYGKAINYDQHDFLHGTAAYGTWSLKFKKIED